MFCPEAGRGHDLLACNPGGHVPVQPQTLCAQRASRWCLAGVSAAPIPWHVHESRHAWRMLPKHRRPRRLSSEERDVWLTQSHQSLSCWLSGPWDLGSQPLGADALSTSPQALPKAPHTCCSVRCSAFKPTHRRQHLWQSPPPRRAHPLTLALSVCCSWSFAFL